MKRLLVRYVLSLCILLVGGYSQLHAHGYNASVHTSSTELVKSREQSNLDLAENSAYSVRQLAAPERHRILFIDAVEGKEEDEQDLVSARKKRHHSDDHFAAVFCALTRGYFLSCIQEILPFPPRFSDASPFRRHLILQVFRI